MRNSSVLLVAWLLAACTITRQYVGSPLRADPAREIHPGSTDMSEVLRTFGAPDRILRHAVGDVFVYSYRRSNSESLTIEEPVITNAQIFSYSRTRQKEDRLVVLFDRQGLVRSFGYLRGTAELERDPDS